MTKSPCPTPELLAPAGQPDAGYAALHYGADAVYLGLGSFSARAEAVNFTPGELGEFVAYAHSLPRPRKVYLTLNTLVKQAELSAAVDTLLVAAECGVDAVIVQDLGVAKLAADRFPTLTLHASTQMAIHNLEGALTAKSLGFKRVTLARELTLREVRRIAEQAGMEVETFIHGTLCYSYSGLCLFSSILTGRSGNRGRCVYSCREGADTPAGFLHPFSLKDMALGARVLDLARAGVASLKIEGRKKSPLYVAATVDYYRRILDGNMAQEEMADCEARLRTIFARPWTTLYLDGTFNPGAADTEVVGHRGSRIGTVEGVARTPAGPAILFRPSLPMERHDGLQVDIPGQARPYGFGVDHLYVMKKGKPESTFSAPAGSLLAAALPEDAPPLSPGLSLYLASSQAVKRSYPFFRPKAGAYEPNLPADIAVGVIPDASNPDQCRITCSAAVETPAFLPEADAPQLSLSHEFPAAAFAAREAAGAEQAARKAFERMGGSGFRLRNWHFDNPGGLYVRPGDWNAVRRQMLDALRDACRARIETARRALVSSLPRPGDAAAAHGQRAWSVLVDSPAALARFADDDFAAAEEIVVTLRPHDDHAQHLSLLNGKHGGKIRLAMPLILRGDDAGAMETAVRSLQRSGVRRWLVSNPAHLRWFAGPDGFDIAADWTLYVLNPLAAQQLLALGVSSFTLSPEDDEANMRDLLADFADAARVVVYADLPLFISAACAHAHLGLCRSPKDGGACRRDAIRLTLERSGALSVHPQSCGSIAASAVPYSLSGKLDTLNRMGARHFAIDLRWVGRGGEETAAIWRAAVGGAIPPGIAANFHRGLI